NTLPGKSDAGYFLHRMMRWYTILFLPALLIGATALPLLRRDPARGSRRLFLLLAAGFFDPLLHGLWPVLTKQDDLPWHPLLFICLTPLVVYGAQWLAARSPVLPAVALLMPLAAGEIVWL